MFSEKEFKGKERKQQKPHPIVNAMNKIFTDYNLIVLLETITSKVSFLLSSQTESMPRRRQASNLYPFRCSVLFCLF